MTATMTRTDRQTLIVTAADRKQLSARVRALEAEGWHLARETGSGNPSALDRLRALTSPGAVDRSVMVRQGVAKPMMLNELGTTGGNSTKEVKKAGYLYR